MPAAFRRAASFANALSKVASLTDERRQFPTLRYCFCRSSAVAIVAGAELILSVRNSETLFTVTGSIKITV
jgi:hypothetical protein